MKKNVFLRSLRIRAIALQAISLLMLLGVTGEAIAQAGDARVWANEPVCQGQVRVNVDTPSVDYYGRTIAANCCYISPGNGITSGDGAATVYVNQSPGTSIRFNATCYSREPDGCSFPHSDGVSNNYIVQSTCTDPPPEEGTDCPAPRYPSPVSGAVNVSAPVTLSWQPSGYTYNVYFGTASNPPRVATEIDATQYTVRTLSPGTRYYWKVETVGQGLAGRDGSDKQASLLAAIGGGSNCPTAGSIWSFTTRSIDAAPIVDILANGSNGPVTIASGQSAVLSWSVTSGYVAGVTQCTASGSWTGTKAVPSGGEIKNSLTGSSYTYRITCDNNGVASSDSVSVNVAACSLGKASNPVPANGATKIPPGTLALKWAPGSCSLSHRVSTGLSSGSLSPYRTVTCADGDGQCSTTFTAEAGTTYYWKVDASNQVTFGLFDKIPLLGKLIKEVYAAINSGNVWSFTTASAGAPNLTISSAPTIYSGTPTPNTTIRLEATVRNAGTLQAGGTFQNRFRIDRDTGSGPDGIWDNNISGNSITGLGGGLTAQTISTGFTLPAGDHRVEVCADSTDVVAESVEGAENCARSTITITTAAEPDLVITDGPELNTGTLGEGNFLTFRGTIRNQGSGAAGAFNGEFRMNGNLLRNSPVASLAAGASTIVTTGNWVASRGQHTLSLCADRNPTQVTESQEGNNCRTWYFEITGTGPTVPPPAPQCSDGVDNDGDNLWDYNSPPISTTDPGCTGYADDDEFDAPSSLPDLDIVTGPVTYTGTPTDNTPMDFRVVVRNIGNDVAGSFLTRFYVDGIALPPDQFRASLSASVNSTIISGTWTAQAGNHTIRACADSGNDVGENNESNNCASLTLDVVAPPPSPPTCITPPNGATDVSVYTDLVWGASTGAVDYQVYFGPGTNRTLRGTTRSTSWALPLLSYYSNYSWRIVARNAGGTASSPICTFRTELPPPPVCTISANPPIILLGYNSTLNWDCYSPGGVDTTVITDDNQLVPDIGPVARTGSQVITPLQTTQYTVTATNIGGTGTDFTTVRVYIPVIKEVQPKYK